MFAVPMGMIGVVAVLLATGTTLNIESFMGIIVMVGIVVSNSILLVDFTNQRRREGAPLRRAVVEASRIRLRPILMTALATVVGLLPIALKLGEGSEASAPLARAAVGGLDRVDGADAGAGAGGLRAALRAASGDTSETNHCDARAQSPAAARAVGCDARHARPSRAGRAAPPVDGRAAEARRRRPRRSPCPATWSASTRRRCTPRSAAT